MATDMLKSEHHQHSPLNSPDTQVWPRPHPWLELDYHSCGVVMGSRGMCRIVLFTCKEPALMVSQGKLMVAVKGNIEGDV